MMMRLNIPPYHISSMHQQRPQRQPNRTSETNPATNNNQNMPIDFETWNEIIDKHEAKLKTSSTTVSKRAG